MCHDMEMSLMEKSKHLCHGGGIRVVDLQDVSVALYSDHLVPSVPYTALAIVAGHQLLVKFAFGRIGRFL